MSGTEGARPGAAGGGLHEEVRALFHELHDLSPEERERRLGTLRPSAEVRRELEELLAKVEQRDSFEESRLGEVGEALLSEAEVEEAPLPERIGDYVVLGKLGEGGMGVVYSARKEGSDERVAIKAIRTGLNAERLSGRFRREVQLLEQLRHPGIAGFHGAGEALVTTPSGETRVPYLVMELVDGPSLLEHARERSLSERERVELVVQVCAALHHAHERGVVHRDLKPANILVDRTAGRGVGQPKLLDFGVARGVDTDLATLTATRTGALIGTVPYMSPEQVDGARRPVDRRSDVYSLGVLTFELLAGELPYDVRNRPLMEAARVILEREPTRLGSLVPRHRGALELVVGKALEKDPAHRYATAADFGADLERYLRGVPVHARRTSWIRELGKLRRRHRVLFATVTGVVAALSIGLVVSIWFALGEASARRLAEERTREANWNLYRSKLEAAAGAIADGDVGLASLELAAAPEGFRGWEWELVSSRLDGAARTLGLGHPVTNKSTKPGILVFRPDGNALVVLDKDRRQATLLDLRSGEPAAVELSLRAAIDPRGERVVRLQGGELILESFPAQERLDSFPLPPDYLSSSKVRELRFVGEQLVLRKLDRQLHSLRCADGELATKLEPLGTLPTGGVWSLDPALEWVAAASRQDGLIVELRRTGRSWAIPGSKHGWLTVWISPDGNTLTGISVDRRTTCWALSADEGPLLAWRREAGRSMTGVLAYSADSSMAASAGETVSVWSTATGEVLHTFGGHRAPVHSVAFAADGKSLASVDNTGEVRTWRLDEDPFALRLGQYLYAAEFDTAGDRILVGNARGELVFLDARSSLEIGRAEARGGLIQDVICDPTGERIVFAMRGGWSSHEIHAIDAASGRLLWSHDLPSRRNHRVAFSSDGGGVFVAGNSGTLELLDAETGVPIVESPRSSRSASILPALAIHGGPGQVLVGGDEGIDLVDPETLVSTRHLDVQGQAVCDLAFSPDEARLAVASKDGTIHVLDVDSWETIAVLLGHASTAYSVRWSPDGRRLFSGSRDTTIRVWDTARWKRVVGLMEHEDYVFSVRPSPDGETLLSCGGDGVARVWGLQSRAERWEEQRLYREVVARFQSWLDELSPGGVEHALSSIRARQGLSDREREIALQQVLARALRGELR